MIYASLSRRRFLGFISSSVRLQNTMSGEPEKPVELEQVPLKSDTDAPAGTTEDAPGAPAPQKKTWFFKKVPVLLPGHRHAM